MDRILNPLKCIFNWTRCALEAHMKMEALEGEVAELKEDVKEIRGMVFDLALQAGVRKKE